VGGILLGYLASALWVGDTGGWRYMYGAALPPALIVFAGMVSPSSTPSSSSAPFLPLTFLLPLPPLFVCRHCLQLVSVAGPLICNATLPQAVAAAFLTYVSAVHSAALCVAQLFLAFVVTGWRRIVEDMTK
jgi:hypothetical protein